ncbi:gephyrin-like molybdotransferase Glp [Salinisphaera sp.]|uniref:molybdopterin molybdotransferase MoeA n=1 Tax=Salinisphaera sp. TaxID=1914330 RepID=UPI002D791D2B|nr:gephyrin-like molybdotransferase Glp [Salinisphaera sp.]HET7312774.1 gephyrin-like molybdotransferase Glp [Salinisphaera sp.]
MPEISRQPADRPGTNNTPMALAEARRRIVAAIRPVEDTERVTLNKALHRVLAERVVAGVDVPSAANSSMDGYGYAAAGVEGPGARLKIAGQSLAGHPFTGRVGPGECVRIMTGAVVPDGVDSVVMQENTRLDGEFMIVEQPSEPGANIRPAGEDLARGQPVLGPGSFLHPADIVVLASVGAAEVTVVRRPRVAFFSTGDELRPIDGALAPGEIYDSNRYGLAAQLESLGMEGVDLGAVGDSSQALAEAFDRAASCDALITSGGVSVGAADFVVDVLADKGAIDFWRVAIKPGKPLAFGALGRTRFFGLPGNPVSTAVTFIQLVRPALVRLAGATPAEPIRMTLPTATDLAKRPGREHFLRARMDFGGASPRVIALDHQGSGVMRSMSRADAFVVLPADWADVPAGTPVTVEPFAQTIWAPVDVPGDA